MKAFVAGSLLFLLLGAVRADELDQVFQEWKETVEASAKRLGESQVLKFDREKGLLVVGKELQLNEMRKNTLVQMARVEHIKPEIELEGPAKLPEPWLKLRLNKGERVSNQRRVIIEGVEVEEVSRDEEKTFLVVSCHRNDLKKAKEQGEKFLGLALKSAP